MPGRPRKRANRDGGWAPLPEDDPYRCKAYSTATGKRCLKTNVPGSSLCWDHGGVSRLMDRRRATWLLELYGKAMDTTTELLGEDDPRMRLAASKLLVDSIDPKAEEDVLSPTHEEAMDMFITRLVRLRKDLGKPIPPDMEEKYGAAADDLYVPPDAETFQEYRERKAWEDATAHGPKALPSGPRALPEADSTRIARELEDLI